MTDPVRSYYRSCPIDLSCITDLTFRHFRFLLPSGRFLKINDRISGPAVLRRWLVRHSPQDVYYSTSCWLSPETLGRRERTPLSANVFLSSDIVFDIDRSPFSLKNLELARLDALALAGWCDENKLPIKYVAFSGSKGFHIVCSDPLRYSAENPLKREDQAREYRSALTKNVCSAGITCDRAVTADTRRIIRVPGTINSKSGYVCTVISRDLLTRAAGEILKSVPRVSLSAPLIPSPGDDLRLRLLRMIPWPFHRFGVRWGPVICFASYLGNAVPGIRMQIPFFEYPSRRRLETVCDELSALQKQYGLSDVYLFSAGTTIQGFSLRTFPLRRLEKIIAASSSVNHNVLVKYHQLFFRIGPARDERRREVMPAPKYIGVVRAGEKNNRQFISLPHLAFFQEWGVPVGSYEKMHGEGEVTVTCSVVET